ncbi:MAG TPA: hypothetical protein VFL42_07120 [Terriglobales bacterium]|nr:hypothetical protein [Terriglobales bacterium]
MVLELARLFVGVLIAIFHRPVACIIMEQERILDALLRRRGINFPAPLSDTTAQNLYFAMGVIICLVQAGRIWFALN